MSIDPNKLSEFTKSILNAQEQREKASTEKMEQIRKSGKTTTLGVVEEGETKLPRKKEIDDLRFGDPEKIVIGGSRTSIVNNPKWSNQK